MGAHSSVDIKESEARKLFREFVGSDQDLTTKQIESFMDRVLDASVLNCCVIQDAHWDVERNDDSEYLRPVETYHSLRSKTEEYVRQHPEERQNSLPNENAILRRLLAIRVGGTALYTDDGELQDSSVMPAIDFKRDSAIEIERKLIERARRTFERDTAQG